MAVNAQQFNNLINQLTVLGNALQPGPQAAREASVVKIDPFFGDEQDPVSWIEDFEKAATANNYTNARKLQIVQAYLKGTATTWLYKRQQSPATNPTAWEHQQGANAAAIATTFRQPFVDHFRTEAKVAGWQQELTNHQQLSLTVDQYAAKLRNLI